MSANLNLLENERNAIELALAQAGTIVGAAQLVGITRHALKRRLIKHNIRWPRPATSSVAPVVPEAAPP